MNKYQNKILNKRQKKNIIDNKSVDVKKTSNKPLEQVNISDLLALHKKS